MQVAAGAPPVGRAARLVAVAAAVAGLDQAAKAWVVAALDDGRTVELIGSSVRFRLVHNSGSAFSLFTEWTPALAIVAAVLVALLVRMGRRETDWWLALALAVVLGGALGNLADRVFRDPGFLRGAVVDFVELGPWPTFNLADAAITLGAVVLLLRGWRGEREHEREQERE